VGRDVRLAMRAGIITAPLASGFGLTAYGNSGSQLTLCWRGMDSNVQFRAKGRQRYLTPRLNRHRARGTDGAPTSCDFVPRRFSDAALRACGRPRHRRRPKTCT
jgi:hypothetical protein